MTTVTRRSWICLLALALAALLMPPAHQRSFAADPATGAASAPQPPEAEPTESFAQPSVEKPAAPGRHAALLRVSGAIYDFTLDSLERRIERARAAGANIIAIELDTYGGTVTAALEISKFLKSLDEHTIVWVNNKAYSAGIIMGAAADELVTAPTGTAGDAAPIVPGVELATTERAKALTPILAELQDSARRNGYHFALLHAMVEYGVEVHEIEHKTTGRRMLVNQVDYQVMVDGTRLADAGKPGLLRQFLPGSEGTAIMLGIVEATEAQRGAWSSVRVVHNGRSLLTLNSPEIVALGLAKSDDIRNVSDLQQYLQADSLVEIRQTWSENLAGWLTSMPVRAVLIFVLLVGAYAELQTPGVGVAGAAALVALLLLLAPPMVIGLAEVWHLAAIVLGVGLLLVEIFVLPGFGIAGVSGLILIVMGLVFMVVPAEGKGPIPLPSPEMWHNVGLSFLSVLVGLMLSVVAFVILQRYMGKLPFVNRLVLRTQPSHGAVAVAGTATAPFGLGGAQVLRVGDVGRASTDLRPAGRADFDGQMLDVVTVGNWIRAGQTVVVTHIEGNRIVVDVRVE